MSTPSQIIGAAIAGALAIPNLTTVRPTNNIGGITIQATIEEQYEDLLEVTDNPVQAGADITDHSFVRPSGLILRCGWSNSSLQATIGAISSLFTGSGVSGSDYVTAVYSQLLAMQQSRQLLSIQTTLRLYQSMLIKSLRVTRDQRTNSALMVTATCRSVILVDTQQSVLPPQANQATPASTAAVTNAGSLQLSTNASPAPGGSLQPTLWGPP